MKWTFNFHFHIPLSGSVRGGNGVTIAFDGTLIVEPSGELARPGSFDFSVAKFLSKLKEIQLVIDSVFEKFHSGEVTNLLVLTFEQFT